MVKGLPKWVRGHIALDTEGRRRACTWSQVTGRGLPFRFMRAEMRKPWLFSASISTVMTFWTIDCCFDTVR